MPIYLDNGAVIRDSVDGGVGLTQDCGCCGEECHDPFNTREEIPFFIATPRIGQLDVGAGSGYRPHTFKNMQYSKDYVFSWEHMHPPSGSINNPGNYSGVNIINTSTETQYGLRESVASGAPNVWFAYPGGINTGLHVYPGTGPFYDPYVPQTLTIEMIALGDLMRVILKVDGVDAHTFLHEPRTWDRCDFDANCYVKYSYYPTQPPGFLGFEDFDASFL